jgi:hypothetical protein
MVKYQCSHFKIFTSKLIPKWLFSGNYLENFAQTLVIRKYEVVMYKTNSPLVRKNGFSEKCMVEIHYNIILKRNTRGPAIHAF